MRVPEPVLSPEDDEKTARPPTQRVLDSLSVANKKLLEFLRKVIRVEIGEGLRPVLAVVSMDLSFEPLDVLWLLHFGVLTLTVDNADRVFLVKNDTTDVVCGAPCKRKRKSVIIGASKTREPTRARTAPKRGGKLSMTSSPRVSRVKSR